MTPYRDFPPLPYGGSWLASSSKNMPPSKATHHLPGGSDHHPNQCRFFGVMSPCLQTCGNCTHLRHVRHHLMLPPIYEAGCTRVERHLEAAVNLPCRIALLPARPCYDLSPLRPSHATSAHTTHPMFTIPLYCGSYNHTSRNHLRRLTSHRILHGSRGRRSSRSLGAPPL